MDVGKYMPFSDYATLGRQQPLNREFSCRSVEIWGNRTK
jgi:hypothetical protein